MLLASASAALAMGRGRAAVAALALLALGYGEWRLSTPFGDGLPIRVAVVQGAVAREPDWDRHTRDANLERYLALTRGVREREARIVFWPEYAVDFYLSEATVQRARLFDGVREAGADVVLGASHYQRDEPETRYFNSVFVVSADGRLREERYDKRALVPFAEYGPLGDWLRAPTAGYAPGDEARLLVAHGARVGAFVCGEALFPEIARALARAGAQILANPSNDYWFGHAGAAAQQLAAASFRAIENRRYLVRPTATGVSAVVDPHGRAIARSRGEGAEVLHAVVRPSREITLYQRIGDAPVALAAGFALATLFASCIRARRDFGGPT
jgi:apolipoprotein N-acyltransferase